MTLVWLELPFVPPGQSYARVESVRGSRGYKADEYYDGKQIGFGVVCEPV